MQATGAGHTRTATTALPKKSCATVVVSRFEISGRCSVYDMCTKKYQGSSTLPRLIRGARLYQITRRVR